MAENNQTRLLRIGQFSTLTRLSVRMLRYYAAHGVLSPADTDDFTGHRFYDSRQVPDALLIRQFRDVGFSVSAIAALLPLRDDPDALGRALAVQRDQFIAEAQGQGVAFADAPCGATFHDEEFRESDIDIEVWMPVPGDAVVASPLPVSEVPERKVAVATFQGDYS